MTLKNAAMRDVFSPKARVVRWIIEFVLLLVVVLLIPSEASLGNLIKLVFIHGAMMGIAGLILVVSGALAVWYLVQKNENALLMSFASQLCAFVYILISFLLSIYLMLASWGGVDMAEPRTRAVMSIVVLAAASVGLNYLFQKPKIAALSGIVLAVFTSYQFAATGVIMHPSNPIWSSGSFSVMLSYGGTLLLLVLIGVEFAAVLFTSRLVRGFRTPASSS